MAGQLGAGGSVTTLDCSLDPLRDLTRLETLKLSSICYNTKVTSLEPLRSLTILKTLDYEGMNAVTTLDCSHMYGVTSLAPLVELRTLTTLKASCRTLRINRDILSTSHAGLKIYGC